MQYWHWGTCWRHDFTEYTEWTWKHLQIQLVRKSTIMCNVPEQRSRYSDDFGRVRNRGLPSDRGKWCLYTKTPWADLGLTTLLSYEYPRSSPSGKSGQVVNVVTYPQLMPRLRKSETLLPFLQMHLWPRPPRAVSGPVEKIFSRPRRKDIPAKNVYTKSERLSVAKWFGLGLKGLICTIDKKWCYRER